MKILIAIEDSKCSTLAVDSVCQRDWSKGTNFRLITVLEPLYTEYGLGAGYVWESMLEAQKQLSTSRQIFLNEAAAKLQAQFGEKHVSSALLQGYVADTILDEAVAWGADLIVLGSHGRKGLQKFLLGSVAEKVVNYANCSVEVVKDKSLAGKVQKAKAGTTANTSGRR